MKEYYEENEYYEEPTESTPKKSGASESEHQKTKDKIECFKKELLDERYEKKRKFSYSKKIGYVKKQN